uniref:DnaA ATPase domain-containing protein n=1 Tax=Cytobacillus sp. FSL W7-1323 TaxID=2921700 RepID=UPI00406D3D23
MPAKSVEDVLSNLRAKMEQKGSVACEPEYDCPECKDKGFILKNIPDLDLDGNQRSWPNGELKFNETIFDCSCAKKRQSRHLLKISELTDEFKRVTFRGFVTEGKPQLIREAYDCAIDYYKDYESIKDERQNSICLLGQPGSGKTHLLTALTNNLILKKQVRVMYFPFVEGFNDLKDDFALLEEKLNKMKRVDALYIDDLFKGRSFPTDFQIEQMFAVINYRYLNFKPLLISSEKTIDDLLDIDEGLGSRIKEMSKGYTVVIKGNRNELNHRLAGE